MKIFNASTLGMLLAVVMSMPVTNAQNPVKDKEYVLAPLGESVKNALAKQVTGPQCGQYFHMTGTVVQPESGKYTVVTFVFVDGTDPAFMIMGWDKFIVRVDNAKKIPTAIYTGPQGPRDTVPFHWIIKISEKDLKEAQACLPTPTV